MVIAPPSRPDVPLPFTLTFDDGGASYYTQIADRLEGSDGADIVS